jgi:recombination protein RecT
MGTQTQELTTTPGHSPAVPDRNPYKSALSKAQAQIVAVIPEYLSPERMIQIAVMSVYRSPLLQQCHPMSVVAAVVEAAACGLEPGGPLQQGDLLPVWNNKAGTYECQFRPRYAGLVQLARNTDELNDIYAEVVYKTDCFEYEMGLDRKLSHRRELSSVERKDADIVAAYAVAKLKNGETNFVVLERWELDKIRSVSESEKAKAKGKIKETTWDTWYGEMAKKSAVKRVCKLIPKSTRLARAIQSDNEPEYDGEVDIRTQVAGATAGKAEDLKARLSAARKPEPAEAEFEDGEPQVPVITADTFDKLLAEEQSRKAAQELSEEEMRESDAKLDGGDATLFKDEATPVSEQLRKGRK